MQVVAHWILARLRHTVLVDVRAADAAIAALLPALNDRKLQKLDGRRASFFATLDSPALSPLPAQLWQRAAFKTVKAHIDYHVEVDFHRYSVPHSPVGLELEARITDSLVGVLHRGQLVAGHARSSRRGGFSTRDEHMPAEGPRRGPCVALSRTQAVGAQAAHPLGSRHRREHRALRHPAAAAIPQSRAQLPQPPGAAQPEQALRPEARRGRLHAGPGTGRGALPACARHPEQRTRSVRGALVTGLVRSMGCRAHRRPPPRARQCPVVATHAMGLARPD